MPYSFQQGTEEGEQGGKREIYRIGVPPALNAGYCYSEKCKVSRIAQPFVLIRTVKRGRCFAGDFIYSVLCVHMF